MMKKYAPVRVVDLGLRAQQLLLTRLVSVVPTDLVAVFLSLEEGKNVQTAPDLLTGEFTGAVHQFLYFPLLW
jgi:hypothetical protein